MAAAAALACVGYVVYGGMESPETSGQAAAGSKRLGYANGSRFLIADGDGSEPVQSRWVADAGLNLQESSLADTQPDGSWSIAPNGQAQPSMALRRRFDYFLLLQGERSIAALTADIERQVLAAHGHVAAQQIMALWNSYLRLQQHRWATQADMLRPNTWASALAERSQLRRELLGLAWADAFYREEEGTLQQQIARSNGQDISPQAGLDTHQPNQSIALPDAALRQAEVDAELKQWQQRLEAARSQVARLQQAPELSGVQRTEAVTAYVNSQFSGTELLRVKALLKL